ncbi:MAG: hypothetical protein M1823_000815 [Watsoniomyces obsoletus]|nr:MAG: hypothetical protein M1823_000815 [Watsoniomyces obsoletus]
MAASSPGDTCVHQSGDEPNKPFRFLDLPFEIRRMVYGRLLRRSYTIITTGDDSYEVYNFDFDSHGLYGGDQADIQLAILRTCKRIYHEALPVMYSESIFDMYPGCSYRHIETIMEKLPLTHRRLIRKVRVMGYLDDVDASNLQLADYLRDLGPARFKTRVTQLELFFQCAEHSFEGKASESIMQSLRSAVLTLPTLKRLVFIPSKPCFFTQDFMDQLVASVRKRADDQMRMVGERSREGEEEEEEGEIQWNL